ncbi:Tn7-like element transposition protein TnsE [Psychrobacter sp.]|uniref:Tn7-like element transposition protein TnsE n=1 Tax=Psychrobacter sp. TaxID=56811 RepID=UPI003C716189
MEIVGLPSDALLTNIGSLSRGDGYKDWLVTVNYIKSRNENDWKGIKFSNAPALCRGRMYSNNSDGSKKGPVFEFTIDDLESWSDFEYFHARYFESPAPVTLRPVGARNISAVCHIPKFELARVLFFYNEYLAICALQGRALNIDFRTEFNGEYHTVEVFDHCTLKPKDFKDEVLRSQLAWLLLNEEMRQSYDSISKCLMHETRRKSEYENWVFNFTPPPLKNIKIKARFYKNQNGVYRVDEILSISNLISNIGPNVDFVGKHFVDDRQSINPLATEVTAKPKDNDNSHTIDDAQEADIDRNKQNIMTPQVALHFQDPIKTSIDYKKIRSRKGPKLVDEQDIDGEPKTAVVATDEATIFGNVPKGDFRNIKNNSDQTINNAKDFEAITHLLEHFKAKHSIDDMTIKYHELPKVKHCRRHKTKDGRPRIMMEARFRYASQRFSVFEVYTADIDKRLSTLIVKVDSYTQLEHKMSEFMTSVVKGSISWTDAAPLLGDYETLNHPIGFYEKECDERMLQKWLSGLESKLI